jgi:hypothetical protein
MASRSSSTLPSADGLSFFGGTLPGFGETATREIHQYTADYTHQFGATVVNDLSLHYSHALDDASSFEGAGFGGAGATAERGYNQYEPRLNYGNSDFDARHRFVFSPVYEVPSLKGSGSFHEVANLLTSGWQISGIMTLAGGFPIDVSYGGFSTSSSRLSASPRGSVCRPPTHIWSSAAMV